MLFSSLFAIATLFAAPALAQSGVGADFDQIEACATSYRMIDYPASGTYTYSTTDSSRYTATFTYNAVNCTTPSQVPINRAGLRDEDADVGYTCTYPPFDSTGRMVITCSVTK